MMKELDAAQTQSAEAERLTLQKNAKEDDTLPVETLQSKKQG